MSTTPWRAACLSATPIARWACGCRNGTYEHDGRELRHTHEGSIGNLCLDGIRAKFERHAFDYAPALKAEEELMK